MGRGRDLHVSKCRNSPLLSLIATFEVPQRLGHGHELPHCLYPIFDGAGGITSASHQGQFCTLVPWSGLKRSGPQPIFQPPRFSTLLTNVSADTVLRESSGDTVPFSRAHPVDVNPSWRPWGHSLGVTVPCPCTSGQPPAVVLGCCFLPSSW